MGTNVLKILGTRIDNLSRVEINDWIENTLDNPPRQKFVVTLNPEIVLKAHRDKKYEDILNSADLALCDGFGIKFVSRIKGKKIESRYTGADLVDYGLKLAKEKNISALAVVSKNSLSAPEEIEKEIEKKYGVTVEAEYFRDDFFGSEAARNAQIVFVNFGAPEQEIFIFENRRKFPKAKILAGVGGAFDFLTGKMKRSPPWMRKTGLEWLWRLFQEPKRIKRIGNAVVVFPWIFFTRKND